MSNYPIIALWAVPRSVSTAFERMMAARGDFQVFNEPFSRAYYFGPDRVSTRYPAEEPCDDHDPEKVRDRILAAAEEGPVFFKDMAYHIHPFLRPGFLEGFTNTCLIRDPRHSIVSLLKKLPDFSRDETGFECLLDLFELLRIKQGDVPVIDGEALRADPIGVSRAFCEAVDIPFTPDALKWKAGKEDHWEHWQEWFDAAAQSNGFRPPAARPDEETLKEPAVAKALTYCLPCYERLAAHALPASGKQAR